MQTTVFFVTRNLLPVFHQNSQCLQPSHLPAACPLLSVGNSGHTQLRLGVQLRLPVQLHAFEICVMQHGQHLLLAFVDWQHQFLGTAMRIVHRPSARTGPILMPATRPCLRLLEHARTALAEMLSIGAHRWPHKT